MKLEKIRAVIYALFFLLSVVVVVIFMAAKNSSHRKFRRIWGKAQDGFLRNEIEIIGEFSSQANMIIMNHQSILDIIVIEDKHPANICWIAKKEIAAMPIIGKIITLPKMISVDRQNPRDLVRVVREAEERIEDGRVIAMFPEGTRRNGKELLEFQKGAKIIAEKLNLKVQPIVLIGTKEILNSHDFAVNRGKTKIICLDLVDLSDNNWLENTRAKMQKVIDENS